MGSGRPTGPGSKSITKIFANIFISFIGAGVLGLPFAFKEVRTSSFLIICLRLFDVLFGIFCDWLVYRYIKGTVLKETQRKT